MDEILDTLGHSVITAAPYISNTINHNSTVGYGIHHNKAMSDWGSAQGLHVNGDAEFDGDVKIKGVSIAKALEDIQKRLAILVPDPAKLEKYEALRKAYNHYILLEKLIGEE